jgi:hypothetical protein
MTHNFTSDINSNPIEFRPEDSDLSTAQTTYMHQNIILRNFLPFMGVLNLTQYEIDLKIIPTTISVTKLPHRVPLY